MKKEILPHVVASITMSVDGCIDDSGAERLILSNALDFNEVHKLRAEQDAILVGANTIRRDNPSLILDSETLKAERRALGLPPDLIKVTLTASGNLDSQLKFFQSGSAAKLVYCPSTIEPSLRVKLGSVAEIIGMADLTPTAILRDLGKRGVQSMIVEGGENIHSAFLAENVVNELRVAIAPFFVGEKNAPRFVSHATFPFNKSRAMKLIGVTQLGNMAVLNYRLA